MVPFKTFEGVSKIQEEGCASHQCYGVGREQPAIRNTRDGMTIKLDVNSGVCTADMWICFGETGQVFGWR